jgi:hypothetical protein
VSWTIFRLCRTNYTTGWFSYRVLGGCCRAHLSITVFVCNSCPMPAALSFASYWIWHSHYLHRTCIWRDAALIYVLCRLCRTNYTTGWSSYRVLGGCCRAQLSFTVLVWRSHCLHRTCNWRDAALIFVLRFLFMRLVLASHQRFLNARVFDSLQKTWHTHRLHWTFWVMDFFSHAVFHGQAVSILVQRSSLLEVSHTFCQATSAYSVGTRH